MGLTLSMVELDRAYRNMIALADIQKSITDEDLVAIIAHVKAENALTST